MNKIAKGDVVPGLLCRSATHADLMVVSAPNSRGMVLVRSFSGRFANSEFTLPYQTLRY